MDNYSRAVMGARWAFPEDVVRCAVLGIRLVHSRPGRPHGRGKIERFFRAVRGQLYANSYSWNETMGMPCGNWMSPPVASTRGT